MLFTCFCTEANTIRLVQRSDDYLFQMKYDILQFSLRAENDMQKQQ